MAAAVEAHNGTYIVRQTIAYMVYQRIYRERRLLSRPLACTPLGPGHLKRRTSLLIGIVAEPYRTRVST
jgi:hypothetical protein